TCPQCGDIQPTQLRANDSANRIGMPITSMILGILCFFGLFDPQPDKDSITGLMVFSIVGLLLGVLSLGKRKAGKKMAIAGVVLTSIALLAFMGMLSS